MYMYFFNQKRANGATSKYNILTLYGWPILNFGTKQPYYLKNTSKKFKEALQWAFGDMSNKPKSCICTFSTKNAKMGQLQSVIYQH